jgi:nifR3 family TIM-barrel protein
MPLKIGPLSFESNLLLCPIAGYCDLSFRLAVRKVGGLSLCYTDLISPQGLLRGSKASKELAETSPDEAPVGVQLYGNVPEDMAAAAEMVVATQNPTLIDINMGCPVPKVAGRGGGCGLMRDLDGAVRLAGAVVEAVGGKVPVTVKMRLGWSEDAIVAPTLARRLEEEAGVSAVTVHGRTGEQKFSGKVRLPGIAQVVAAVKRIPVIGNGDVDGPEAAERMIRETGCAGVMIGRAALSDQWIFRETHARLSGLPPPPPATADERVAVMTAHFRHLLARRGEHAAVTQFRQRISWYSARLAPCPELKRRMREMTSAAEFDDIVGWFLERRRADPKAMC